VTGVLLVPISSDYVSRQTILDTFKLLRFLANQLRRPHEIRVHCAFRLRKSRAVELGESLVKLSL